MASRQDGEDNRMFPYCQPSLDVEQVRCTLKDVLQLERQEPYKKTTVTLSNRPRKEYFGSHKDPNMQLPVRVMWGNRINWALMLRILSNPQRTGHRVPHTVKKFEVPVYVVELLQSLPLVVGFGIRGGVLPVKDMFSLLTGRPVNLSGFVELGSLMLYAGWALPTCNMPSCHALQSR